MQRNTAGRYRVGARDTKEAIKLLRAAIGFGNITIGWECLPGMYNNWAPAVGYKEVVQEVPSHNEKGQFFFKRIQPHHASTPYASHVNSKKGV
jgi:hypothetical protein